MGPLVLAAFAEVGVIAWRSATRGNGRGGKVPWPADFAAVAVVYGLLGALGEAGPDWAKVGAAAGWGIVLATTLNLFDPTSLAAAQRTVARKPAAVTPAQQGAL